MHFPSSVLCHLLTLAHLEGNHSGELLYASCMDEVLVAMMRTLVRQPIVDFSKTFIPVPLIELPMQPRNDIGAWIIPGRTIPKFQ